MLHLKSTTGSSPRKSAAPRRPSLVRARVRRLHAYVPGEQPKIKGLIKLNTNENPYPPSPQVLAAVRAAVDGRLRLYPDPSAQALREKLARLHRCRAVVQRLCKQAAAAAAAASSYSRQRQSPDIVAQRAAATQRVAAVEERRIDVAARAITFAFYGVLTFLFDC